MRTSDLVFKDIKIEPKPQFIAEPRIREGMDSVCDIPSRTQESQKEFPLINFDFLKNHTYPECWIFDMIKDEKLKALAKENLKKD